VVIKGERRKARGVVVGVVDGIKDTEAVKLMPDEWLKMGWDGSRRTLSLALW